MPYIGWEDSTRDQHPLAPSATVALLERELDSAIGKLACVDSDFGSDYLAVPCDDY